LGDPIMWLAAMAMFFFAPVEVGVSTWITTYLDENGVSEKAAAVLLSAFWLVYTFARLTAAFALPAGWERIFIVAAGLASIAILATMVFGRSRNMAIVMVVLAGIVFGPTFPTIIAVLLGHFEPSLHGRAVGLFFAVGGVGWTIIPMAIGAYAKRTSIQRGFLMAMLSAVCLTGVAVALLFTP
jgi:fucose permease